MKNTNKQYHTLLSASASNIAQTETKARFKAAKKFLRNNYDIEYFNLVILASENMSREYTEASIQDVIDGKYQFKGKFKKLAKKSNFSHINIHYAFGAFSALGFHLFDKGLQMYSYRNDLPRDLSPLSVIMPKNFRNIIAAGNTASMNDDFAFDAVVHYGGV